MKIRLIERLTNNNNSRTYLHLILTISHNHEQFKIKKKTIDKNQINSVSNFQNTYFVAAEC